MELRSAIITFLYAEFLFKVTVKVYKTFVGFLKIQNTNVASLAASNTIIFYIVFECIFQKGRIFKMTVESLIIDLTVKCLISLSLAQSSSTVNMLTNFCFFCLAGI